MVDGHLPVRIRNLAYRLVLPQQPDEPVLLREAAENLWMHGSGERAVGLHRHPIARARLQTEDRGASEHGLAKRDRLPHGRTMCPARLCEGCRWRATGP
ncbi:hypothetical protein SMICM17S_05711 [Streptomyces microflavus]